MPHDQAYLQAEKKIEEALKSGATELDLRNMKLTELPESIGQLTQLKKLDVGGDSWIDEKNQLTKLPDSLGQLTQLTGLNLSNNQLALLPESLGQLTQLTELNLSKNQLALLPELLGQLTQLTELNLSNNQLTLLPESLGQLTQLTELNLSNNQLTALPESLGQLTQLMFLQLYINKLVVLPRSILKLTSLQSLNLTENPQLTLPNWLGQLTQLKYFTYSRNPLIELPEWLSQLKNLEALYVNLSQIKEIPNWISQFTKLRKLQLSSNQLKSVPDAISQLGLLEELTLSDNQIVDLPKSLTKLEHLEEISLQNNPLNAELAEAHRQGTEAVKLYLRAGAVVSSYEAKLILVGEGEVGKTCLMDALLNRPWQEHRSTHGIEIQSFKITYLEKENIGKAEDIEKPVDKNNKQETQTEITFNGWDFGGQRVYRPTHQLFFSAPAVYLVVWKPREGPQQGFVKEWIQLVKRREPSAKIIVVATHGGPQQRQPDIDRQELWDTFGKETVVDFFFVDSKPDKKGKRKNIKELKQAIARVAATLPEVGRSVPKSFADVRAALQQKNVPYLPFDEVLDICREHKMDDEIARLFITISHRLGHLTHYENDPTLRDIVILRPDWLASAMSYVLDDEETRKDHGLVKLSHLSQLWNDPSRPDETRYPEKLHKIFLRLMERFDLSYRVAGLSPNEETNPISLIAQLVPDNRPEKDLEREWLPAPSPGDIQQTQICRIVDAQNGQSANAEGLFYQLIVRLHRYTLGRTDYNDSVHWQRGLVLDDDYNGRALLEHVGNDVRITVRAPYPEFFLAMLTREVKYMVESFWEGLRCDVMVPCVEPCGRNAVGIGLYEVERLIDSKRKGRPEFPCPVCNEWQNIDYLLRNAPAAQPDVTALIFAEFAEVKAELAKARGQITYLGEKTMGRFDRLDERTRRTLSRVDKTYADLIQVFTDEAKDGPRLFSLVPVDRSNFNPKEWIRAEFKLTLWCEHSRQPLNSPDLDGVNSTTGIYTFEIEREWFKKVAPYLRVMMGVLSLALPVVSSGVKLRMDENAYKAIEEQLDFGKSTIEAAIGAGEKIGEWMSSTETTSLEEGDPIRAQGAMLREFHALLKSVDKSGSYGGLRKVMNKRQEFLWVHEKFTGEY